MDEEYQTESIGIQDLLPKSWFSENQDFRVWVTCYRLLRVIPHDFDPETRHVLDIGDIRVAFLFGSFKFIDSNKVKAQIVTPTPDTFVMNIVGEITEEDTPFEGYTFFFSRFDNSLDASVQESKTRNDIKIAVGLLAAFNGKNVVYEHFFDNLIEIPAGEKTIHGSLLENPLFSPIPDISLNRIQAISFANETIKKLNNPDKNRVNLSLRWLEKAIYSKGVDTVIAYWIAIETLAMPDSTNIKPVIELLASAYKLSYAEARDEFQVGRLFRLRGNIIHDGQLFPIQVNLFDYLEALYVDILFEFLGLTTEQRIRNLINSEIFTSLLDYIPNANP